MEIQDIVKNTKKIYMSDSSMETLMDFERVLDEVDLYAFKNWKRGELIEGPIKTAHWVECSFMWPYKMMPDPDGGKRLLGYNVIVEYSKDKLKTPVKLKDYGDFQPGTRKPKLKTDPVWVVKIKMPSELVKDAVEGFIELEGREIDMADLDDAYQEDLDNMTAGTPAPEAAV